MPIFVLRCTACDKHVEKILSFDKAKEQVCEVCGEPMEIAPANSNFRVHGFNAENGYHRPTINYDGTGE